MSDNMELLRMIMENNAGQAPAFILKQYAIYRAGLEDIHGQPVAGDVEELASAVTATLPAGKEARPSRTAGYTKRSLKVNPATAVQDDKIICCICGFEGKTITRRHLALHNGLTREGYLKLCGYPSKQKLMSNNHYKEMQQHAFKAQEARRVKCKEKAREDM